MSLFALFIIAVGLSMDAFAAAISKGLSLKAFNLKFAVIVGLYFGIFQAIMPLVSYLLGARFQNLIASIDHWIAFILLATIGINMIRESRNRENDLNGDLLIQKESPLCFKKMSVLAFSTSVDALAAGVSFALLDVRIIPAITIIGVVTFLLSVIGVKIGHVFGCKYKSKAEFAGGAILLLMGIHILLEHTGVMSFIYF